MIRPVTYAIWHVPKTGGKSLQDYFQTSLSDEGAFVHLRTRDHVQAFASVPAATRARARVIIGHAVSKEIADLLPDNEVRFAAFLREPAARIVSRYNFSMKKDFQRKGKPPPQFDDWYRNISRNDVTGAAFKKFAFHWPTFILSKMGVERRLEPVLNAFRQFYLVGTLETLSEGANRLGADLGLPEFRSHRNVTGVHHQELLTLTDALRDRLNRENALDMALYQAFARPQA